MNECIICKNQNNPPLYSGILKCPNCSHAYADACLSDEELTQLYSRNYFFGEEYSDYFADRRVLEKNFKLRMNVLNRYLSPNSQNLLEIGCAYGFFLNLVKNRFQSVQGIDLNADGVQYARQELALQTIEGDFLKVNFKDQLFDVVCLWDTIEHLSSPHLYLEKIAGHTKKGSLIAITTGDIDSLNATFRKKNWRLIHPPTHLHYFSMKSITKLLNKNGFEVIYKKHCGFYRSLENALYNIFVLRNKSLFLYNLLKKTKLTSLDFYLNLYDIMYVIARKR
jgi:2-polyprenyl-3-methyl-5-hydroxy-6-metoxy-1,4-benzoquinol methylase